MIYDQKDPATIQALFGSIAKQYDRTNSLLSLRLHKRWNRELVRKMLGATTPKSVLDLCAGTGDIAFGFLEQAPHLEHIHLLDFCEEMLLSAKVKGQKYAKDKISYINADAQKIPLKDASISCATVAYGIRNVADPQKCFEEVYRVLEKGGVFGILELTRPKNPLLATGHRLYLNTALPLLGKWATSNKEAYQYLCRTVQNFMDPDKLESMMIKAGFGKTSQTQLSFGTATILLGHKI